jgi:hypothetical protein
LIPSIVLLPDNNLLSFKILVLVNINCLLVDEVNEMFSLSLEDLPPVRVSASNNNILGISA